MPYEYLYNVHTVYSNGFMEYTYNEDHFVSIKQKYIHSYTIVWSNELCSFLPGRVWL